MPDQHPAHERLLNEGPRARGREGGVARQPLLITETVELAPARVARIAAAAEPLLRLGFEVDAFGEAAVAVRAIPALRHSEAADTLFASLACHAARRAGERLESREQQALLAALDTIPFAPTCPHGRPVAVPIARGDLERRFGRA
jgi:DNA mismatch repair protein MutL